ncbi:hypothetical protein J7J41_01485 [bacterium]|nr:hypothetical protein [bacterium]
MIKIFNELKEGLKEVRKILQEGKELKITITVGISGRKKEDLLLNWPIEKLNLSVRAEQALKRNGIHFVRDILNTPQELLKLKSMGRKSANEILRKLQEKGLSLPPKGRR